MDEVVARKMAAQLVGKEIGGWKVSEYVGSGGTALVCEAKRNSQTRAIKIYDPAMVKQFGIEEVDERIKRQLALVGKKHENLVGIYDGGYCENSKYFYLVMEIINAKNLGEIIDKLPCERIGPLIAQVASAALFLEEMQLAHRDIKPDNIAVTDDFSKAVLLDLGVIRPVGKGNFTNGTDTLPFLGTTRYSSPEYLLRKEEDSIEGWRALTFYQLGAVLHDMIMKYPIFKEESEPYARLVQAVCNEIPRVRSADVDPEIVSLAEHCLMKKPEWRVKLVNWNDFEFSKKNLKDLGDVKKRIKKRQKKHQYISSNSVESGADETQRNLAQKMYDIGGSLDAIIRGICIESAAFPPLEIDRIDEQNEVNVFVRFACSKEHSLKKDLTIVVKLCLLDFDSSVIQVQSTGVLSDKRYSGEPKVMTELFEGIFNEDIIRAKLDEAIHKLFDHGQGYCESGSDYCDTDSAGKSFKLIMLNFEGGDNT